jgi:hypothetical protein
MKNHGSTVVGPTIEVARCTRSFWKRRRAFSCSPPPPVSRRGAATRKPCLSTSRSTHRTGWSLCGNTSFVGQRSFANRANSARSVFVLNFQQRDLQTPNNQRPV